MARVPGTFNGGVPPNLKWDPLNPPLKCDNCGMVDVHLDHCDGTATKSPITESECELLNEHREWARLGISTATVTRDLFKMGNQLQALINVLKDLIEDGDHVLNEAYRQQTINEMRRIRLANEDEIKRRNLGLPAKGVLGPDGNPL